MAEITKCLSWRGHKFTPRYDEKPPQLNHIKGCIDPDVVDMITAMTIKTYCRDVCVRCGQTVERESHDQHPLA